MPLRAAQTNMLDTLVHKLDMKLQQFFSEFAHALGELDDEFVQFAQQVFGASEDQSQLAQRLFAALKILGSWELGLGDSEANHQQHLALQASPSREKPNASAGTSGGGNSLLPIHELDAMALAASSALKEYEVAIALAVDLALEAVRYAEAMLPSDYEHHQILQDACDCLSDGKELLDALVIPNHGFTSDSIKQCAKAYKKVIKARKLVHEALPGCQKWTLRAALVVREVVIMMCSVVAKDNTKTAFNEILNDAFEKQLLVEFDDFKYGELSSQLHLSLSLMTTLGGNEEEFTNKASDIFGRKLSDDEKACLFVVYRARYDNASNWQSSRCKNRKKGKKSKKGKGNELSNEPVHVPARASILSMNVDGLGGGDPLKVILPR